MKVSTDRPRAMTGTPAGLKARVKKMNPSIIWHHCCIHTETLAAKNMPEKFKIVLDDIVQVVNVIKTRPINFRIFGVICEEMGAIHKQLLLHAEVLYATPINMLINSITLNGSQWWHIWLISSVPLTS